jgi:hypothetical protein
MIVGIKLYIDNKETLAIKGLDKIKDCGSFAVWKVAPEKFKNIDLPSFIKKCEDFPTILAWQFEYDGVKEDVLAR